MKYFSQTLLSVAVCKAHILVDNTTNSMVKSIKFIALATVPGILPLVDTELRNVTYKFTCWKVGSCIFVIGKQTADLAAATARSLS